MLRGGQARVVREHADARADAQASEHQRVVHLDLAVLLRERADARARVRAFEVEHATEAARRVEFYRAAILRERDGARVEDDFAARAVAVHDRGENRQRAVAYTATAERRLEGVEEDVVAGPRLVNAVEVVYVHDGRGRADADQRHLYAVRAQSPGELSHQVALVARDGEQFFARARVIRMSGVSEYACEAQVRRVVNEARDFEGFGAVSLDAAAVVAAVNFQKQVEHDTCAPRRLVEPAGGLRVVRDEREALAALRQLKRFFKLARLDGHSVGDVAEAVRCEGARLRERRDGDAAAVPFGLYARDLDALVRLDVRAQGSAELSDTLAHTLGVTPGARDVEQERRRFDRPQVHDGELPVTITLSVQLSLGQKD